MALEHGDPDFAPRAMDEIRKQLLILERNPFTCRIADDNPYERELIIPFGRTGYVALFEIVGEDEVVISAFRQQREDDYH